MIQSKYNVTFEEPNGKRNTVSIFHYYDSNAKERAKTLASLAEFKLISIIKEVEIPID